MSTTPEFISADELFARSRSEVFVRTDRLFAGLMLFQFLAAVAVTLLISPRTYNGTQSTIHPHVIAALVIGGLVSFPPIVMVLLLPGRAVTRYTISVCQALTSALLIHLSGGRIETHFHIFGSLAFLAFYRDWRVLIPATIVTTADHFLRNVYVPQSIFGVVAASQWRWLEHAGWVVFEDIFLISGCLASVREMRTTAEQTAELSRQNAMLTATRATALDCVIGLDHLGRIIDFNAAAEQTFGYQAKDVIGRPLDDVITPPAMRAQQGSQLQRYLRSGEENLLNQRIEVPAIRADGTEFPVELAMTAVRIDGAPTFVAYLRDITDRKRFEAQAKHAEMLSLVASRTDNAVIITDPAGKIEWANEGFTRITGYTLQEVIGRKPGGVLQGKLTDPATVARMREHLQRGEGFTEEIVNYGKNGREYWLALEVQPIRNADGSLQHFMAIESDVTARKMIEAELHASRERFELAVRGSSDGLWDWNVITGEVYFSPMFHEQLGYTDGELPPTISTFQNALHPDDRDRVAEAIAAAHTQKNEVYRIEFRMRHKAGHDVWILSRGVTLHDADGRATRMSGSHTDITVQRQAAEALRTAEEKYRGLFENSVLGIFQCTRDGHYLSANPAMARIYGYDSPAEVVGGLIDIGRQHYVNPKRRAELVAILDRDGTVTGFEAEIRRTDGSHRWISKKARVVRDADGKPLYYEGTVEDITDSKAAQAALRQAKEDAETARSAAEAASVAKSQFLANMSHEIRTPLNGVIGVSELLMRKGGLNDQQLHYANMIKSSGDSLLSLINDVLDFSKIEAGKLDLAPVEFDFRAAVEDVVEMLAAKADAKGLAMVCQVSRNTPMRLIGDPDRLRQILINLVNNAIKFTESGSVQIRTEVLSRDEKEATLKLTVCDTGVGIPKDRLDRLFKLFSQVDASTTRKYGGTGLGLAIVKQLAEIMGGTVGVDSTAGKGSAFWFTAKFAIAAAPTENTSTLHAHMASELNGMRVLLVDDEPAYLEALREQLATWGVDADTCTSGAAALELLQGAARRAQPYKLAMIDIMMPVMSGLELTKQVKASPDIAATPIVLMTAMDYSLAMKQAGESCTHECLSKPIRHSTLFDMLANQAADGRGAVSSQLAVVPTDKTLHAHVLLAEDNEVNQEVAREILVDAGCTVEIVNNGVAAIAAATDRAKSFDLVLMDCQMPEMDGFEATRHIRAALGTALPIIALTANAVTGDRERCLEAGMTDYVSKPIDPDVLLLTITKQLASSKHLKTAAPVIAPAAPQLAEATVSQETLPINKDELMRRCRGKTQLAERLLKMFADSVDAQLNELRTTLTGADWSTFTRVAHTIKGASANLAANSVSDLAGRLETIGRAAEHTGAEAILAQLEQQVRECIAFIPTVSEKTSPTVDHLKPSVA